TLVDEERLFYKSVMGLDPPDIPRGNSFCDHTIQSEGIFEVQDTLADERFKEHPGVTGPPYARFYAGAPLLDANGYKLGAISVFDTKPNKLTSEQENGLQTLAREIITHMTLRKKTLELEVNTQRFEDLLNLSTVSPEIHCILDRNGKILFINDAVTSILEYSVEEAIGASIWMFCNEEDISSSRSFIEEGLRNGQKQFKVDFRIIAKSGALRWISWSMVTKSNRWYAYGRDITEGKRVENELMKLSFVASKVNNAVVINDANNHVTWVNDAFEKITGYTLDDLKGKRLGDLIAGPLTDIDLLNKARLLTKQNQSFTVDLLCYRKNNQPIWLSIYNTVVLNDEGSVDVEVEIIIDITDKKKAEQEMLEAKEQALQLSEAKEMFLSVMSHEIRTPLNAVIGMTHLLLENDPKISQIEDLNILKFSGENLLNIINDILDFTKIETGHLQLESIPFSIHALTNDIINSLQVNAIKKSNNMVLDIDDAIPANVLGDKTRLYQILMNLLGNAIKFTDYGKIKLVAKQIAETEKDVLVNFEIRDTGIGIPEDKQSYIFESFTQAKPDISRKYGGTGLGLAITKKLLKLYNSDIQVKSKEGKGTVFSFSICFNKVSDNDRISRVPDKLPAFIHKKLLVVDDNEINILIAKRILSKWGFDLDFAADGHQAIEKVMKQRYDLIFMDIRMPGIDGFETAAIIRELPGSHFKSVPIIALTASSLEDENERYKASGINGHILKPFQPDEIKAMLMVYFSDIWAGYLAGDLKVELVNNIIWGSLAEEILIDKKTS
ncbi:MAG: PAS domain S-box protein, partial [Pedobacter sp.]